MVAEGVVEGGLGDGGETMEEGSEEKIQEARTRSRKKTPWDHLNSHSSPIKSKKDWRFLLICFSSEQQNIMEAGHTSSHQAIMLPFLLTMLFAPMNIAIESYVGEFPGSGLTWSV